MAELAGKALHPDSHALRVTISGHVQGVGFRPFIYRLARQHGLTGSVQNRLGEVEVIACGMRDALEEFQRDIIREAPPLSRPAIDDVQPAGDAEFDDFQIAESSASAEARVFVPPDYFMCDDCRRELHDAKDRRYRYPFINCTQCGPRYTLIEALPYDRPNTSMASFPLCADCEAEYLDPADRRFHAEPVACAACGPALSLTLDEALTVLDNGEVLAVKGIGGYHLMCDARDERAVARLRERKHRPDKPLAIMFPLAGKDGLDVLRRYADPTPEECQLLASPVRPIVLTRKRDSDLADNIARGLDEIGAFLPYSPLHELLLGGFAAPVVATSGNISGEPVLTDNAEVESRLGQVADAFLHHDRRIVRPADDPVFRRIDTAMRPLRIGRGCAPLELELPWRLPQPLLAVGGHMKGTLALAWDDRVVVSPHIGEMDSPRSLAVFEQVAEDLQELYGVTAERIVCDAHPGYTTHRWAKRRKLPLDTVWHHHAHAGAVAAEHRRDGQWLVFAWDGVGLGEDDSLWGGEALLGRAGTWRRVGSWRGFRLPGGERAGREPWRSAASLYWTSGKRWSGGADKVDLARQAWHKGVNCPETSAVGRLFDAAAALICNLHTTSFEAQGPMVLEALCRERREPVLLPLARDAEGVWRSDWEPLLDVLGDERRDRIARAEIFHASVAEALVQQARAVRDKYAVDQVGLSGGVFQNRFLTEQVVESLDSDGFDVFIPQVLPCNDAGLSYGQVAEFAARVTRGRHRG